MVGGGGGANGSSGAGGGYTKTETITVTPGQDITIQVASGGIKGNGGNTIVGSISGNGGWGLYNSYNGGNGGSGGGAYGRYTTSNDYSVSGGGGSDGGNGGSSMAAKPGMYCTSINHGGFGQGKTTRVFGESDGTLYAGGGGAMAFGEQYHAIPGGAGGGGNGTYWDYYDIGSGAPYFHPSTDGETNTGGGSGGGINSYWSHDSTWSVGGSGIVILRFLA